MFLFWKVALFFVAVGLRHVVGNGLLPVEFPIEKTDQSAVEKWKTLDQIMRDSVESLIRQILPMAVRSSSEVNLSADCAASLLRMVIGLKQLKEWPLKMLDANGKIPSGLLSGTMGDFGHYDQCMDIRVSNIHEDSEEFILQGQYCMVEFRPPLPPKPTSRIRLKSRLLALNNLTTDNFAVQYMKQNADKFYSGGATFGICVPSTCNKTDVEKILSFVASKFGLYSHVHTCEVKEAKKIDSLMYFLIGVCGFLVLLFIIGTAVDSLPYDRDETSPKERGREALFRQLLTSFSVKKTVHHLLRTDENTRVQPLQCIHGFRFFSSAWIVLTFTYMFHGATKMKNAAIVAEYLMDTPFQIIANGPICMETFFCIGGLVMSYSLLKATQNNRKFYQYVPMIIGRRMWALLPSIFITVILAIIVPIISSGPLWRNLSESHAEHCRKNWFHSVLFISNYVEQNTTCIPHLWYTSIDFQFYLLAIILLAIFRRNTSFGVGVNITLIMSSIICTAVITYWKNFDPIIGAGIVNAEEMNDHVKFINLMPTTHLASYCIGFVLGVYLVKCRRKINIHPVIQVCGWGMSTILCLTVLLTPVRWNRGIPFNTVEQVLFSGLHRPVWTLGVSWVIFACATGNGGVVNKILSWRALVPLSRLTFQVYLQSPAVIMFYIGSQRDMPYANNMLGVWEFFGHLVITYLLAFLAHILYAGPFILMGKIIFARLMRGYDVQECKSSTDATTIICTQYKKT